MKMINKKKALTIFVTASFVLLTLTGCGKVEAPVNNRVDTPVITNPTTDNTITDKADVSKEEAKGNVVTSGGVLTDQYVDKVTEQEVPVVAQKEVMTEEEAVSYFEKIEAKVNEYANSENFANLKDKASSLFITTVDFIFYDGEIKGVTFDSLSNSAKIKILNIAKRIDTTIMKKWPTYKEDIKTTGGNILSSVTTKIGEGIDIVDSKLEEKIGTDEYNSIKDNFNTAKDEVKDAAGDIWEGTKDVAGTAKEKVKSWYEKFKDKHNNQ